MSRSKKFKGGLFFESDEFPDTLVHLENVSVYAAQYVHHVDPSLSRSNIYTSIRKLLKSIFLNRAIREDGENGDVFPANETYSHYLHSIFPSDSWVVKRIYTDPRGEFNAIRRLPVIPSLAVPVHYLVVTVQQQSPSSYIVTMFDSQREYIDVHTQKAIPILDIISPQHVIYLQTTTKKYDGTLDELMRLPFRSIPLNERLRMAREMIDTMNDVHEKSQLIHHQINGTTILFYKKEVLHLALSEFRQSSIEHDSMLESECVNENRKLGYLLQTFLLPPPKQEDRIRRSDLPVFDEVIIPTKEDVYLRMRENIQRERTDLQRIRHMVAAPTDEILSFRQVEQQDTRLKELRIFAIGEPPTIKLGGGDDGQVFAVSDEYKQFIQTISTYPTEYYVVKVITNDRHRTFLNEAQVSTVFRGMVDNVILPIHWACWLKHKTTGEFVFLDSISTPNALDELEHHLLRKNGMVILGILSAPWMDGSLDKFVDRYQESIPYDLRLNICKQIATIMLDVHDRGYLHRDLDIMNFVYQWIPDESSPFGYTMKIFVIDFAWYERIHGNPEKDYRLFRLTCRHILLPMLGRLPADPMGKILEIYGERICDILFDQIILPYEYTTKVNTLIRTLI
jgi:serine/threonine protein kinase